jgi:hypothetical protein
MPTREEALPKFAVGSQVRAKKGATAPNYSDMPLGGWRGTVSQVSGTIYLVRWSGETLAAAGPIYREQWRRDGVDFRAMWLQEKALEADPQAASCVEPEEQVDAA